MFPLGAIFVVFRPKTGTDMLHPRPPQSLNWSYIHTCYFGTFTYGRLQQREKSARREGHPRLRFVHDFVSVVYTHEKVVGGAILAPNEL